MNKFICLQCGRPFKASRFWARFCTASCRLKAHYKQAKGRSQLKKRGMLI